MRSTPSQTEEHARDFLFRRGILKQTLSCSSCNTPMNLIPCYASKSPDLLIWRCPPCKKFRNIRTDSSLSGQKLSLQQFLILLFDIKSLTNIAIAQLTGLSENTISDWKIYLHTRVADWLAVNLTPLGGPGVIFELDEAKFGVSVQNL